MVDHGTDEAMRLTATLADLYDCVIDPSGWPKALASLTSFVGGSSALLFHQDYRNQSGGFVQSHNADPYWTRLYFEKYVRLNPVLPFLAFMDTGATTAFSRLVDPDEFRRTVFHKEWAAPQGFLDVVVTVLDKSATASGMFAVTLTESDGIAGSGEIARMELVSPHVRRTVHLAGCFEALGARSQALASAIDVLAEAAFFLDGSAGVVLANEAALTLSAKAWALRIEADVLVGGSATVTSAIRRAVAGIAEGELAQGTATIDLGAGPSEGERWVASVLPLSLARRSSASRAVALLLVRRAAADGPASASTLAQIYGLTPREMQVLGGIVQFGGVPEVARLFGLSATTVRSHLQKVFDKTGVRSQTDLVRLAASLAPPRRK